MSRRYEASDRGRATRARYRASAQGRSARARYGASEQGKAAKARYEASEKGQAMRARYRASSQGKAVRAGINARRLYIGEQYHSMAATAEQAATIRSHVAGLMAEFRARQRAQTCEFLESLQAGVHNDEPRHGA
jgi:hypothetical protein